MRNCVNPNYAAPQLIVSFAVAEVLLRPFLLCQKNIDKPP